MEAMMTGRFILAIGLALALASDARADEGSLANPLERLIALVLSLYGTRTTDAAMPALTECANLEVLTLSRTHVTDDGLAPLARLPRVKQLDLDGTQVTQAGADRLQKLLPGCEVRFRAATSAVIECD